MVEAVCMVQIGFVQERVSPSAPLGGERWVLGGKGCENKGGTHMR